MAWKVCVPGFQNAENIFPTQQRDVLKIVTVAMSDKNIERVTIFGSSVTLACNPWSDIDAYFDILEDKPLPFFGLENSLDAWTNFSVDKDLKAEIIKTGVVVYERDATR